MCYFTVATVHDCRLSGVYNVPPVKSCWPEVKYMCILEVLYISFLSLASLYFWRNCNKSIVNFALQMLNMCVQVARNNSVMKPTSRPSTQTGIKTASSKSRGGRVGQSGGHDVMSLALRPSQPLHVSHVTSSASTRLDYRWTATWQTNKVTNIHPV